MVLALMFMGLMAIAILATDEKPPKIIPKTELSINANLLAEHFDNNVVRAEADYKDKIIEITGEIYKIGKADVVTKALSSAEYYIILQTAPRIKCEFDGSARDRLAKLSPCSRVTLIGECHGLIGSTIYFEDCYFADSLSK